VIAAAVLAGTLALVGLAEGTRAQAPPTVVDAVDLKRYAGRWYEIARFPNRFQDHCAGEVTATYALRPDGRIDVVNRCRTKSGETDEAAGIAKYAGDDRSGAKLKVRFAPSFLSFLPFVWGDYWVLGLGAEYDWVVVGDPGREYLWILSRTPRLDEAVYQRAVTIAKEQGFDVGRLVRTRQEAPASGEVSARSRLP
jgi:apolipoprotein D and lipocalin family protein